MIVLAVCIAANASPVHATETVPGEILQLERLLVELQLRDLPAIYRLTLRILYDFIKGQAAFVQRRETLDADALADRPEHIKAVADELAENKAATTTAIHGLIDINLERHFQLRAGLADLNRLAPPPNQVTPLGLDADKDCFHVHTSSSKYFLS